MRIAASGRGEGGPGACTDLYDRIVSQLGAPPSLLIVHCSASAELESEIGGVYRHSGQTPIFGRTSCLGVVTHLGVHISTAGGRGMLGVHDPDGSFGVGASMIHDDPGEAARSAVLAALKDAGRPGEVPAFVLMSSAPGHEEALLRGIASVVGPDVPVAGGSSADDNVGGTWKQFANGEVYGSAVAVAVLFPSTEMMFAFHSGYQPTNVSGTVTKVRDRVICEIDGRPAGEVYNEWTGDLIAEQVASGGCILSQTTFHPLGRVMGAIGAIPYYKLTHPNHANADGTINVFSDIALGDELVLMSGTVESLVTRAGRVALSAMEAYCATPDDVEGALIMFCGGCMLGVRDRLDEVVASLKSALPEIPFLVTFSFGEQGCFLGGGNQHGNLMISVLLFAKGHDA